MSDDELIEIFKKAAWESDRKKFENLTPQTTIEELCIDSVALYDIFGELEDQLGIYFPDDRLSDIRTIGDLIALIKEIQ